MSYKSLEACINGFEKNGQLIRINEEVDTYLEIASIQLIVYKKGAKGMLLKR